MTLASLAELRVLIADTTEQVKRAYRKALIPSRRNLFFLESFIAQLEFLQFLDMRPEFIQAGLQALKEEMFRIRKEDFSEIGNVITFKPETERLFREAIVQVLDKI